jgi:hypothetical protein
MAANASYMRGPCFAAYELSPVVLPVRFSFAVALFFLLPTCAHRLLPSSSSSSSSEIGYPYTLSCRLFSSTTINCTLNAPHRRRCRRSSSARHNSFSFVSAFLVVFRSVHSSSSSPLPTYLPMLLSLFSRAARASVAMSSPPRRTRAPPAAAHDSI